MIVMGVDPGLNGGISFVHDDGRLLSYRKMPVRPLKEGKKIVDIVAISALIARAEPSHVFIERAQAMPHQGVVSMFNYGMGYGMILGVCLALEQVFPTQTVTPRAWQSFIYGNIKSEEQPKTKAMRHAYTIWPHLSKEGVTHDGIIDSALIAEYGRRFIKLQ